MNVSTEQRKIGADGLNSEWSRVVAVLAAGSVALSFAAADAMAQAVEEGAATAADKRGYFFNPSPDERLRPLGPDRPVQLGLNESAPDLVVFSGTTVRF